MAVCEIPALTPTLFLVDLGFVEQEWRRYALCIGRHDEDPTFFFPEKGSSTVRVKEFCAECPVKSDCILHAITVNERFGIWGGMGERARRKVKHLVADGWSLAAAIREIEAHPNQRMGKVM